MPTRHRRSPLIRLAAVAIGGIVVLVGAAAGLFWGRMWLSLPVLDGRLAVPGLSAPVDITRDARGVPTVTAATRLDLARALGFLHGQERFFQMDTLRRAAAGELSAAVGPAAVEIDKARRVHRFRARAQARLAGATAEERAILDAYTAGVNAGLDALTVAPFEYLLLRRSPEPWKPEDSLLVLVAMYFDLQQSRGEDEVRRAAARDRLGPALADFLFPVGTDWDAPLDDTRLPEPPLPGPDALKKRAASDLPPLPAEGGGEPFALGSNAWAVGGALTAHGGGMVANDMHLGHGVPNIWYRAKLVVAPKDGGEPPRMTVGVTLPGTPAVVAGSNGRIAWGFTNSYIDTGDLIELEATGDGWKSYRTPDGPKPFTTHEETLCRVDDPCGTLTVEETVWGPVVRSEDGRKYAYRWAAHDLPGQLMQPFLDLEEAGDVDEALAISRRAGIPHQNLNVADHKGNLAWTVMGQVPNRVGFDGRLPSSWASGERRWDGYLPGDRVPTVLNPPDGRIWTANGRVVGGEAFALLGDGGYALGSRARQIRDALRAKDRFAEADLMAIQLDDRGLLLDRWQGLMLATLGAEKGVPEFAAMAREVERWGGRAVPESIGYRLVREFRQSLLDQIYGAFLAVDPTKPETRRAIPDQAEGPVWRLLTERPAHLVPPGFADWEAVVTAALFAVKGSVDRDADGDLARYTWGARNMAAIAHPLARVIKPLGTLTDAPREPLPGDTYQPRVQAPGFGASERFVIAPGREEQALFHMPGGQAGNPLSPYYLGGHDDWAKGRPTPLLPGPVAWTLTLTP